MISFGEEIRAGERDVWERGLPPVFVPVLKLELNPILSCFVTTEVVES